MIGWLPFSFDENVASVRYRALWPLAALRKQGLAISLYHAAGRDLYSTVIISKRASYGDLLLASQLKRAKKNLVFDICDNHFYNPNALADYTSLRERLLIMMGLADRVVSSTQTLSDVICAETGGRITPVVVGDPVDEILLPPNSAARTGPPILLWFGSHGSPNAPAGMLDILRIRERLVEAYALQPFELLVVSNNREKFERFIAPLPLRTRFEPWSEDTFAAQLASAAGVILPLSDNPFVASKTHNRLSLALGAGVPVIADAIPSYRELAPYCWLEDWAGGLAAVLQRPREARAKAAGAREYLRRHWSMDVIADQWRRCLEPFKCSASGSSLPT